MERAILTVVALSVLAGLSGCVGPEYGPTYAYPAYGYAPYSYGFAVYTRGYQPDFVVRHPWEEHHAYGHPRTSSAQKLPILRAVHQAAPPDSAVAVAGADARLRSPRSFRNTRLFKGCATSLLKGCATSFPRVAALASGSAVPRARFSGHQVSENPNADKTQLLAPSTD